MQHAILLTLAHLDKKEDADSLARNLMRLINSTNKMHTNAIVTGVQVQQFDPEMGGVVIYQP